MKTKTSTLIMIMLVIGLTANAQWTQCEQPTGGYCWSVERVGSQLWASYNYGIYVSLNDGARWTKYPNLADPVMDIETKGDTVVILKQGFTAPNNYRLETMTSYDLGQTWSSLVTAESDNSGYTWGGRELYVMDAAWVINSNSENFYRSTDFGLTWNAMTFPQTFLDVTAHSKKFMTCFSYIGSTGYNYYSANGGATWNLLDSSYSGFNALIIDSTFYFNGGAYIVSTNDFGLTYDTLSANPLNGSSRLSYYNGKIYLSYYGSGPIQYESADGCHTWNPSTLPVEIFWVEEDYALPIAYSEWLINSRTDGLYRYSPYSGTYYKTETGIKAHTVTFLKENNGVLFSKADDILYTSHDAGTTWVPVPSYISGSGTEDFAFKGDSVFGITYINGTGKMCYSYDNAITWDTMQFTNGTHWKSPQCIIESDDKLYIGNSNYVAVSNDWGASWDSISNALDTLCFGGGGGITHLVACNHELFYGDDDGLVAKYDTVSQTWKNKLCVYMPGVQYSMLVSADNRLAFDGGGYFYVSADTGNTWVVPSLIGWPGPYKPNSLTSVYGIWYAPSNGYLYYSLDFGNHWIQLPTNFDMKVSGYSEEIAAGLNGILYAAGNNVWRNNDTLELITGNVYFDDNNSGTKDTGEAGIPGVVMHTSPNNIAFSTDSAGDYGFLTAAIGDTLSPSPPTNFCTSNPAWYLTNGAAGNVDFGLYFTPGIQDFMIDMTNCSAFSPGFNTITDVQVKNKGTVAIPALLQVILDTSLIYVNSSIAPSQILGDTLIFNIDTLHILQSSTVWIETETPVSDTLGQPIACSAAIYPIAGDTVPADNTSQLSTVVTGSFDPNDKTATCGPYFTPAQLQNGEEVVYIIRFQNTGTAPAQNIHITDTLSGFFPLQSFHVISSSHAMHYTVEGNGVVSFYFDNILLPAVSTDEPGSHGFVKFAVKCNPALTIGDAIDNTSYIYFDFNAAVQTNTATFIIADPPLNLSVHDAVNVSHLTIYPNPATRFLNGRFDSQGMKNFSLVIYNTLGKPLRKETLKGDRFGVDVSAFPAGLYFGKIVIQGEEKQIFFRFIVTR